MDRIISLSNELNQISGQRATEIIKWLDNHGLEESRLIIEVELEAFIDPEPVDLIIKKVLLLRSALSTIGNMTREVALPIVTSMAIMNDMKHGINTSEEDPELRESVLDDVMTYPREMVGPTFLNEVNNTINSFVRRGYISKQTSEDKSRWTIPQETKTILTMIAEEDKPVETWYLHVLGLAMKAIVEMVTKNVLQYYFQVSPVVDESKDVVEFKDIHSALAWLTLAHNYAHDFLDVIPKIRYFYAYAVLDILIRLRNTNERKQLLDQFWHLVDERLDIPLFKDSFYGVTIPDELPSREDTLKWIIQMS